MTKYDVIVIGSGPSGATTARWCAKFGFSTLVIDKSKFPRDKPCGGMVSTRAIRQLDFGINETVQQVYYQGKLFRPKGDFFTLKSGSPLAVGVLRTDFDFLLAQMATIEGAVFRDREKVEKIVLTKSGISVSCSSGFSAIGEVLVGADGASSIVARQVGIRERWCPDEVGLACVSESRIGKKALEDSGFESLEFYLGVTPAGYGWVFPKGEYVSIGAGAILKELHSSRDILSIFAKIDKLRSTKITNQKWHLVPIGGRNAQIGMDRVLLVGDAAGFVDPLVGEGIPYSISSGKKAALSIRASLETGKPDRSSAIYYRLCRDLFEDLGYAYFFATKVYYYTDLALSPFVSDDRLGEIFTEVLRGTKNYKEFVLAALRRMPVSIGKMFFNKLKGHTQNSIAHGKHSNGQR